MWEVENRCWNYLYNFFPSSLRSTGCVIQRQRAVMGGIRVRHALQRLRYVRGKSCQPVRDQWSFLHPRWFRHQHDRTDSKQRHGGESSFHKYCRSVDSSICTVARIPAQWQFDCLIEHCVHMLYNGYSSNEGTGQYKNCSEEKTRLVCTRKKKRHSRLSKWAGVKWVLGVRPSAVVAWPVWPSFYTYYTLYYTITCRRGTSIVKIGKRILSH